MVIPLASAFLFSIHILISANYFGPLFILTGISATDTSCAQNCLMRKTAKFRLLFYEYCAFGHTTYWHEYVSIACQLLKSRHVWTSCWQYTVKMRAKREFVFGYCKETFLNTFSHILNQQAYYVFVFLSSQAPPTL